MCLLSIVTYVYIADGRPYIKLLGIAKCNMVGLQLIFILFIFSDFI
jgi:hypothetical protein